jgi:hypothetical protein
MRKMFGIVNNVRKFTMILGKLMLMYKQLKNFWAIFIRGNSFGRPRGVHPLARGGGRSPWQKDADAFI